MKIQAQTIPMTYIGNKAGSMPTDTALDTFAKHLEMKRLIC